MGKGIELNNTEVILHVFKICHNINKQGLYSRESHNTCWEFDMASMYNQEWHIVTQERRSSDKDCNQKTLFGREPEKINNKNNNLHITLK